MNLILLSSPNFCGLFLSFLSSSAPTFEHTNEDSSHSYVNMAGVDVIGSFDTTDRLQVNSRLFD